MKRLTVFVFIATCSLAFQWFAFSQSAVYAEGGLGEAIDCTNVSINYVDDPSLTQEERLRLMDKAFQESLDKFELCRSARELAKSSGAVAGNGTGTGTGDGDGAGAGSGNDAGTAAGDGTEGDSQGSDGAKGDSKGSDGTKSESRGSPGEAGGMSMGESVASSTMSGTEAAKTTSPAKGLEAGGQTGLQGSDGTKDDSKGSPGEAGGMPMGESVASSTMSGTEAVKTTPPAKGIEAAEQTGLQGSRNQNESSGSTTAQNMGLSNGKPPEDIPSARNDDTLAAQIRYAAETETDPEKKRQLWNEYRKYKGLPIK